MRNSRNKSALATGALAWFAALCSCAPARAAEHITLANGFDLICSHHQLIDGKVRIYLNPTAPDYFELNPAAIAAFETVPDALLAPATPPPAAQIPPQPQPPQGTEAKLTPGEMQQLLSKAGAQHNVDEDLLASVVKAESGGQIRAVSRTGARGLMQLMPGTARQLGVTDSFAPDQNIQGGTAYLDALLTRYRDNIVLALAAYNAGPRAVDRYRGIPPYRETQLYVARVIHEFNRRVLARKNAARTAWTATHSNAQLAGVSSTGANPGSGRD